MSDNEHSRLTEYLQYLERHSVEEKISDALLMLFEERVKPSDPIEYLRKKLDPNNEDECEIIKIKSQIESATVELARLQSERDRLKASLERSENDKWSTGHEDDEGSEQS